ARRRASRPRSTRSPRSRSSSSTPRAWRRWPTTFGRGCRPTPGSHHPRGRAERPVALKALGHALLLLTAAAGLLTGCASPPQVVQITPERNARDVSSALPVEVRFDRAVDRASVASRFHLKPGVEGRIRWASDSQLVFEHQPLRPSTSYQVVLDPGYRDQQGNMNALRHSWSFVTEAPPVLTGSSPGNGDQGVDPAAYLSLTFSREMDLASLAGTIGVSPSLSFSLRKDPSEPRRVILAP